jgi:hypothetical protein
LTFFVFAWDSIAIKGGGETLSTAFERSLHHPLSRWPVVLTWAAVTIHLFGRFPPKVDPFQLLRKVLERQNG